MLDDLDRRILRHWQADAGLSPVDLADLTGLTPGKVARRIVRMQETGIVEGVGMVIDWGALGYNVEVSLRITLEKAQSNAFDMFLEAARKVPAVIEIQTFLGRLDVRLSIIARDMGHYQQIYRGDILTLPHIADIEALMHVARIKSDEALPL